MAVADARVPCPLCGGLIHPIAGRCKHCKADVAAQRAARPAAVASLPPLASAAPAPPPIGSSPSPYVPQPAFVAPNAMPISAAPIALPALSSESGPVLPPRPTGRMQSEAPRSIWRNWPMLVIVVAVVAIAAAVVIMMWPPPNEAKAGSRRLPPPPAPERMDTNPIPPRSGQGDPWNNGTVPRTPPPPAPAPPANPDPDDDRAAIDPDAQPDDPAIDPRDPLLDPFASPRPNRGQRNPRPGVRPNPYFGGGPDPFASMGGTAFMFTALSRLCERAKSCSNDVDLLCQSLDSFPTPPPPPSCPAATRCLAELDKLDVCGAGSSPTAFTSLFQTATSCMDAMRC